MPSNFALKSASRPYIEAHAPKPVLLHFGESHYGSGIGYGNESEGVGEDIDGTGGSGEASDASTWVAVDMPVQMFRIGRLLVAAVPAEVTTMVGQCRLTPS